MTVVTPYNLRQEVTYWAPNGYNDFSVPTFATPIKLMCRWEERTELVRDAAGDEFTSKAVLFLSAEVAKDGYIVLGDYTNPPVTNPHLIKAEEIKEVKVTPDLRNLRKEIRAFL